MERGAGLGIAWKSNENDLADFSNELCSCDTFFRYYLKRCILFIYLYYIILESMYCKRNAFTFIRARIVGVAKKQRLDGSASLNN